MHICTSFLPGHQVRESTEQPFTAPMVKDLVVGTSAEEHLIRSRRDPNLVARRNNKCSIWCKKRRRRAWEEREARQPVAAAVLYVSYPAEEVRCIIFFFILDHVSSALGRVQQSGEDDKLHVRSIFLLHLILG